MLRYPLSKSGFSIFLFPAAFFSENTPDGIRDEFDGEGGDRFSDIHSLLEVGSPKAVFKDQMVEQTYRRSHVLRGLNTLPGPRHRFRRAFQENLAIIVARSRTKRPEFREPVEENLIDRFPVDSLWEGQELQ